MLGNAGGLYRTAEIVSMVYVGSIGEVTYNLRRVEQRDRGLRGCVTLKTSAMHRGERPNDGQV